MCVGEFCSFNKDGDCDGEAISDIVSEMSIECETSSFDVVTMINKYFLHIIYKQRLYCIN